MITRSLSLPPSLSLSLLLLRQVMFTLLTTRNSRESNAMVRTATLIYVTLQNHFVFFTWKAQEIWYLLPFNFSKNHPTLTQYGPLTIHIMIGCWQKCGFATLTIKYIRSVIEKWGHMSNMPVILQKTFAFYYMVRVTYQLHPALAINCSVTRQFTFSSLNSESGDIASILCTLFRKLSLHVWFIILKCVIKRVWLFHLYILWPNSPPKEEKKNKAKRHQLSTGPPPQVFASIAIYCYTLNREIITTSKSFLMQTLLCTHK